MELLVLFDVDGTLFVTDDPLIGEATNAAIEDVWGIRPQPGAIDHVDHTGQTALHITRQILKREGLEDAAIDAGLGRWCDAASARYLDLLAEQDTSGWRSPPGAADALRQIPLRALLTGNPEPVARARMEKLGLAGFFPADQGAFGCESEQRVGLIALARGRAGDWPQRRTVAVGDTPVDVAGARAAGIHVVAFASDRCHRDELTGADAVIERMDDLPPALELISAAT